jgi:hypothetical protein
VEYAFHVDDIGFVISTKRAMKADSIARSAAMMKAVLDGQTYESVAKAAGMTHSAVEQRIKALARELQAVVGVVGADEGHIPTVRSLRTLKEHYLEALEHYRPDYPSARRARNGAASVVQIDHAVEKRT